MTGVAVDVDAAVADGRREALDVLGQIAQVVERVLTVFESIIAPGLEEGTPLEWPLPDSLVKERWQLAAFVATMAALPEAVRQQVKTVYVVEATKAKAASGMLALAELSTAPVLPETKQAAAELSEMLEEVKRATLFDRELRDTLRPLLRPGGWTLIHERKDGS